MIAQELEVSLHMAFVEARQARYEFITVEHLLLALLDNPSAAEVMRACAVNIEDLRKTLGNFISDNTPTVPGTGEHRVARAVAQHPALVGGPHRGVTAVLESVPGILAKDGADGVFAAALPDGSCLALKVADGGDRPVRAVVADALLRIAPREHHEAVRAMGRTEVLGHGLPVGEVVPVLRTAEPAAEAG